jgi:hypothetical protein
MSIIKAIFKIFNQLTVGPRHMFMSEPTNFKKYSPEAQAFKIRKANEKRAKRRERRLRNGI